ncbi:MAG: transcription antitermination factor NusB [Simkaniaceae bacterium]|nr:transcription antitermination factor NusB [Simkaniaceae bacterium]
MRISPAKLRELIFLVIYAEDFNDEVDLGLIKEMAKVSRSNAEFARCRADEVRAHIPQIDTIISDVSKEYALERIPAIERNILRLATFELCIDHDVPEKVAIAEAIRLTRKFCTPEAAKFVNGVLNHIYKEVVLLCS